MTKQTDLQYVANTYGRFDLALASAKGATYTDEAGKDYIDLGTGIGVTAFGAGDPEWVAAVTAQLTTLGHTSNLYYTAPQAKLAQLLCEKTGMKKVFYGNSGAEANECALKVARKYGEATGRNVIVTLWNSFHGRTIATLAATGQDKFHAHMSERWPVLERGKPAAETNRKHLPVQLFKQATRIDEQIKAVDKLISDVTVFNAGRKRDELTTALARLLPAADRFKRQVETMQGTMGTLKKENDQLETDLEEARAANNELLVTLKALEQRNRQVEKLLQRIPKEVLEDAKARPVKARSR